VNEAGPRGERARLFVAVVPPEHVLDAVAALDRPDLPGVRWTGREQWHVTLRFLGSVEVTEAVAAFDRVRATATEAVLGPAVERFNPSVLAVPVAGLDDVTAAVVDAMGHVGKPEAPRPFRGHLTLARARGRGRIDRRLVPDLPIEARWPVDSVELVCSHLHPHGARYETIRTATLA
jgi:RNA 2',3'-cyclic 3'-phosphodiesterase